MACDALWVDVPEAVSLGKKININDVEYRAASVRITKLKHNNDLHISYMC